MMPETLVNIPMIKLSSLKNTPWKGTLPWFMVVEGSKLSEAALALNRVPKIVRVLVLQQLYDDTDFIPKNQISKNSTFRNNTKKVNNDFGNTDENIGTESPEEFKISNKVFANSKNVSGRLSEDFDTSYKRVNGYNPDPKDRNLDINQKRQNKDANYQKPLELCIAYTNGIYFLQCYKDYISVSNLITSLSMPIRDIDINSDNEDLIISCGRDILAYNLVRKKKIPICTTGHSVMKVRFIKDRHIIVTISYTGRITLISSKNYKTVFKINLSGVSITHVDIAYNDNGNIIIAVVDRDKGVRIVLIDQNNEVYEYKLFINLKSLESISSISVLPTYDCILVGTNMINFVIIHLPECVIVDYQNLNAVLKEIQRSGENEKYGNQNQQRTNDYSDSSFSSNLNENAKCNEEYGNNFAPSSSQQLISNIFKDLKVSFQLDPNNMSYKISSGIKEYVNMEYLSVSEDRKYIWINCECLGDKSICITLEGKKMKLAGRLYGDSQSVIYDSGDVIIATDYMGRLLFGFDHQEVNFGRLTTTDNDIDFSTQLEQMNDVIEKIKEFVKKNPQIFNSPPSSGMVNQDLSSISPLEGTKDVLLELLVMADIHISTINYLKDMKNDTFNLSLIKNNLEILKEYYKRFDIPGSTGNNFPMTLTESKTFTLSEEDQETTTKCFEGYKEQLLENVLFLLDRISSYKEVLRQNDEIRHVKYNTPVNVINEIQVPEGYAIINTKHCLEELHRKNVSLERNNDELLRRISSHYEAFIVYEKLINQLKEKLKDSVQLQQRSTSKTDVGCAIPDDANDTEKHVRFADEETRSSCKDHSPSTIQDPIKGLYQKIQDRFVVGEDVRCSSVEELVVLVEQLIDGQLVSRAAQADERDNDTQTSPAEGD